MTAKDFSDVQAVNSELRHGRVVRPALVGVATMVQQGEVDQGCVWRAEARHRADNLRQLATSLQRLIDIGRIDPGNRPRTIGRVNALARAYRTLDQSDAADPHSCAQGLRDIAA